MIPGLPSPWIILGLVVAFVANGFYWDYRGHKAEKLEWIALEAGRDKIATDALLKNKDEVRAQEQARQAFIDHLEDQHAKDAKAMDGLRLANGRLIDAACGLYDKNGRPIPEGGSDRVSGDPDAPRSAQGRPAGCNIPSQVLAAVQRFGDGVADLLHEADGAALYAATGHAYAVGLTGR